MAHKFNPKDFKKLDNEKRRKEMPPKETLEKLLLEKDNTVIDIGCGIGYFSLPASKIIGNKNKVYAVDIEEKMLEELSKRTKKEKIKNIEIIKGNEYNSKIEDNVIDYLFLANIFHEVDEKDRFLENYLSKVKKQGKIAIIEWKKIKTEFGPPLDERLSENDLIQILEKHKIEIIKKVDLSNTHYGVVGIKKG